MNLKKENAKEKLTDVIIEFFLYIVIYGIGYFVLSVLGVFGEWDSEFQGLIGAIILLLILIPIAILINKRRSTARTEKTKLCDLHTHSYFSDGTLSPTELIALAEKQGLSAIMLTDHNIIDGLPEFLAAAKNKNIEAVPGIELSTEYKGRELHLIGAFIPEDKLDCLNDALKELRERKLLASRMLIERLREAGYDITFEEVASTTSGTMNRAHIGAVLTEKGYTGSISEAITTVLSEGAGYYEPPKRLPTLEAIRLVKELSGVAILAHPLFSISEGELRELLSEAVPAGLDAIESIYSTYDEKTTEIAREIAREFSLLESGGSDFHGGRKPDIELAFGRGNLRVPYELYEKLKARSIEYMGEK